MPVRPDHTASTRSPWAWKALHGPQSFYTGKDVFKVYKKQTIMRLKTLLSTEAGKLVPGARPQIAGTPPRAGEQRKWQNWGGNAIFGQR